MSYGGCFSQGWNIVCERGLSRLVFSFVYHCIVHSMNNIVNKDYKS